MDGVVDWSESAEGYPVRVRRDGQNFERSSETEARAWLAERVAPGTGNVIQDMRNRAHATDSWVVDKREWDSEKSIETIFFAINKK